MYINLIYINWIAFPGKGLKSFITYAIMNSFSWPFFRNSSDVYYTKWLHHSLMQVVLHQMEDFVDKLLVCNESESDFRQASITVRTSYLYLHSTLVDGSAGCLRGVKLLMHVWWNAHCQAGDENLLSPLQFILKWFVGRWLWMFILEVRIIIITILL